MGFLTRLVATFFLLLSTFSTLFFYLPACSAFSAPSLWLLIVESDITNTFSVSQLQLLRVVAGRPFPYDKDQCLLLFLIPDIIANEIPVYRGSSAMPLQGGCLMHIEYHILSDPRFA